MPVAGECATTAPLSQAVLELVQLVQGPLPQLQTVELVSVVSQMQLLKQVVPVPQVTSQECVLQASRPLQIEHIKQAPVAQTRTAEKVASVAQLQSVGEVVLVPQVAVQNPQAKRVSLQLTLDTAIASKDWPAVIELTGELAALEEMGFQ